MKKKYRHYLIIIMFAGIFYLPPVAFGQDCKIPHSASTVAGSIEGVKVLSEKAANMFQGGDVPCAMYILKQSANMVLKMKSGQDRAIAGYEIKDVVFFAINDEKLTDAKMQAQAIRLALQSLTPNEEVLPETSPEERINDASFLFRIVNLFRKEGNVEDASRTFLIMLQIAKTIEKSKVPYGSYDITQFTEWLLKQSAFSTIISVLKTMPSDDYKSSVITRLVWPLYTSGVGRASWNPYLLNYKAGNLLLSNGTSPAAKTPEPKESAVSFDKQTTLRYAEDAEHLMQVISMELSHDKNISAPPTWNLRLHKFIWKSYLAAGTPQEAKKKLNAWISAIRGIDNCTMRVRELKNAAQEIIFSKEDKQLADSLNKEAEEEKKLIDSPKCREKDKKTPKEKKAVPIPKK